MRAGAETGRAEPNSAQRFSLREAARILEVPEARLRALARAGLLTPQRGPIGPLSFGFQDLLLLRTTKGLLESGVPMRQIRRIWASRVAAKSCVDRRRVHVVEFHRFLTIG